MRHLTVLACLRLFFSRLLDRASGRSLPCAAARCTEHKETGDSTAQADAAATQKEALRHGLRETLLRNGIPGSWISMDTQRSMHATGTPGIHARLKVHKWDERLVACMVSLERDFLRRLSLLDVHRADWLRGVSWQFELADDAPCRPLPHPGSWTAEPRPERAEPARPPRGSEAQVIAGPVLIRDLPVREDLARLLSARDAEFQNHGRKPDGFIRTVPAALMADPSPGTPLPTAPQPRS
jgi:hypothetical protein